MVLARESGAGVCGTIVRNRGEDGKGAPRVSLSSLLLVVAHGRLLGFGVSVGGRRHVDRVEEEGEDEERERKAVDVYMELRVFGLGRVDS